MWGCGSSKSPKVNRNTDKICSVFSFRKMTKIKGPSLKDKSGVVIIVDYSRNYTNVNGV